MLSSFASANSVDAGKSESVTEAGVASFGAVASFFAASFLQEKMNSARVQIRRIFFIKNESN